MPQYKTIQSHVHFDHIKLIKYFIHSFKDIHLPYEPVSKKYENFHKALLLRYVRV